MAALILNILRCNYEDLPESCVGAQHIARKIVRATLQIDATVRPSATELVNLVDKPEILFSTPGDFLRME